MPFGFSGYLEQLVGVAGLRIGFTPGRDDICVSIPGNACTLLGDRKVFQIVEALDGKPSRVDVAYDHCGFTPQMLDRAWSRGDVNTRVRRSGDSYLFMQNADGNQTLYMGSKASETRLCCYDKRGFTRMELRLRKGRAGKFWKLLQTRGVDALPQLGLGVLTAHADFVKRSSSGDSNQTRARRLRWWAQFVQDAEKVRLSEPDPAPSLSRLERHIVKQAPSLVTFLEVKRVRGECPRRALDELLEVGSYRINDRHRLLMMMAGS